LYQLKDNSWKYDIIPEIMDGKNIADFIDPDIEDKLEALEREESRLVEQGFYESDEDLMDEDAMRQRTKKDLVIAAHRSGKGKNRPVIPMKLRGHGGPSRVRRSLGRQGHQRVEGSEFHRSAGVQCERLEKQSAVSGHAV
ncbi:hypothetical protein BDK51DRAFT_35301, partial [Blyttiomyces helicus]